MTLKERVRDFRSIFGPGIIAGASDDDPSGISTYSVAGAQTGYSTLWLALITTPMMAVVQGMCSRLAMVTGRGLAANMKRHMPRSLTLVLAAIVVVANTFNAGADIAGMGASAALVLHAPVLLWVLLFGVATAAMQLWLPYAQIARTIKWLTFALLAYVVTAFVVHPPWAQVLHGIVIPQFRWNAIWLATVVAVLGTTITPYLFFWQSALEVEQEKSEGKTTLAERRGTDERAVKRSHIDINTGMIMSNLVALFIMITTASTLGAHGQTHIASAAQAAQALRPFAGDFTASLFALGMVGTGLLAIPSLTASSAYIASEIFGMREGLGEKFARARGFYAVLLGGVLVGVIMNFFHVDPIGLLFWSAVLNGVAAVPIVAVVVMMASNHKIMGKWRSSPVARAWGWFTFALMAAAAIGMVVTSIHS